MKIEAVFPDDLEEFEERVAATVAKACYLEFGEKKSRAIINILEEHIK